MEQPLPFPLGVGVHVPVMTLFSLTVTATEMWTTETEITMKGITKYLSPVGGGLIMGGGGGLHIALDPLLASTSCGDSCFIGASPVLTF